jgi:hypothetical protein
MKDVGRQECGATAEDTDHLCKGVETRGVHPRPVAGVAVIVVTELIELDYVACIDANAIQRDGNGRLDGTSGPRIIIRKEKRAERIDTDR